MHEIDLEPEPEVEAWLLDLRYSHYQRVLRNVDDYLVTGGMPDGNHVKELQDADDVYELRGRARSHHVAGQFLETRRPGHHPAFRLPENP